MSIGHVEKVKLLVAILGTDAHLNGQYRPHLQNITSLKYQWWKLETHSGRRNEIALPQQGLEVAPVKVSMIYTCPSPYTGLW